MMNQLKSKSRERRAQEVIRSPSWGLPSHALWIFRRRFLLLFKVPAGSPRGLLAIIVYCLLFDYLSFFSQNHPT